MYSLINDLNKSKLEPRGPYPEKLYLRVPCLKEERQELSRAESSLSRVQEALESERRQRQDQEQRAAELEQEHAARLQQERQGRRQELEDREQTHALQMKVTL